MPPWIDPLFHPSDWDWGDAATWFTGIFTALPLFIVLWQLRTNTKRELTRQAKSVVVFVTNDYGSKLKRDEDSGTQYDESIVHIWNYSDRPIFKVSILYFWNSWSAPVGVGEILEGRGEGFVEVVHPEREHVVRQKVPTDEAFGCWSVMFQDIDGQRWTYNLLRERLESEKEFLKQLNHEAKRRALANGTYLSWRARYNAQFRRSVFGRLTERVKGRD